MSERLGADDRSGSYTPRDGMHSDSAQGEAPRDRRWHDAPIVLETYGVGKRFGGIIAADDLAIELRKGTITALVGPNGAGKTTVFNLLTGFIRPDSRVGAAQRRRAGRAEPRQGGPHGSGALVPGRAPDQTHHLPAERDAGGAGPGRGEHRARCSSAAGRLKRGEEETRAEGDGLARLRRHGGVRRRPRRRPVVRAVEAASRSPRVLATEADVLLLDEPASGIDTKWVDTMLDLIEAVRDQGRTVCIVEHNLHVVGRLADHTYFMELGRHHRRRARSTS